MHNIIYLIGRLTKDVELVKEGEKDVAKITLAVQRNYKNEEGIYEVDFIPVTLWYGVAQNTAEYCHKGDLVGIKGRMQRYNGNDYTANGLPILEIIAEKVTFLSSKRDGE